MPLNLMAENEWVPASCILPTANQPLRRREFDDLFAQDVLAVHQASPTEVRFKLRADPDVAARAADLAARETGCCSFFTFELTIADGTIGMVVSAEPAHEPVLAALAARAHTTMGARS